MKAVVYERYGPPEVLTLKEVPRPVPEADEILVRVHSTTVHIGDVRMRKPDPFLARLVNGIFKPRRIPILGMEFAGTVEAGGRDVVRFKPGDQVFGFTGFGFGAYAEYLCVSCNGTTNKGLAAHKPNNLSFDEAAALPGGGMTALNLVDKANIKPGQAVLIYGASGSIGTYAVQLAKHKGAEVTAVCSGPNFEMVRSLGADHTIDYTQQDFTQSDTKYAVILDAVHKLNSSHAKKSLVNGGIYLDAHKDSDSDPKAGPEAMERIKALAEQGTVKPVIDRRYALEQIVEAHHYVEQGHKKGNVVIQVI